MSTRRQYAIAALVCVGAIALTMVLMWRHYWPRDWTDVNISSAQLQGDGIVHDILTYKQAHGAWPPDLQTVGHGETRAPLGTRSWHYRVDGDGFTLEVVGAPYGYPSVTYDSKKMSWVIDM